MKWVLLATLLTFVHAPTRAEPCTAELETISLPLPTGDPLEVWAQVGVFTPNSAESQLYGFRLLEAAFAQRLTPTHRILVIGAGGGFEALALAKRSAARIDALDVDPAAVALTRANIRRHGLQTRVRAAQSDLFAAARGRYDLILFNAPRPIQKEWIIANLGATEGESVWRSKIVRSPDRFDPNGRLLARCLRQSAQHLKPRGKFLLMSAEDISPYLPKTLRQQVLSVDPWCEDAREGRFAIHALSLAGKK